MVRSPRSIRLLPATMLLAIVCSMTREGAVCAAQESTSEHTGTVAQPTAAIDRTRTSIQRGLKFLETDVAQWRTEHECSTCHHGIMTVWAYSEARQRGYAVDANTLVETTDWAKKRFIDRIDLPRDTRPGWSMVSTPAIYLALMAQFADQQEVISRDELQRIAGHLLRHQENDGSWAWSSAPPANRPPPFFESDEVATRLAYLALGSPELAGQQQRHAIRGSREKAAAWLAQAKPEDTTQAAAIGLLMSARAEPGPESLASQIGQLLQRQNQDGGWGQLTGSPSDAYATGQVLYVLNLAGVKSNRGEVLRGVAFLVGNQNQNGSWPMKSRAHLGAEPYKNPVPITYFGSAWATLGLMRSVPMHPAS